MATTVRNFLNKNAPTRIRVPESVTKVQNIQRDLKGNYSVQNAIDTTPGLSQLQKDNANTIASRMNKWGGSDEINNVLGKTNVNSIINDPVKALDPGDPNSISRQFASENDLKDPEKFKKDFNDDIQKLAAEDYTNLKTDAAKKMADGIKQKAGARTDAIKKYLKYAAIAGALAGSIQLSLLHGQMRTLDATYTKRMEARKKHASRVTAVKDLHAEMPMELPGQTEDAVTEVAEQDKEKHADALKRQ